MAIFLVGGLQDYEWLVNFPKPNILYNSLSLSLTKNLLSLAFFWLPYPFLCTHPISWGNHLDSSHYCIIKFHSRQIVFYFNQDFCYWYLMHACKNKLDKRFLTQLLKFSLTFFVIKMSLLVKIFIFCGYHHYRWNEINKDYLKMK